MSAISIVFLAAFAQDLIDLRVGHAVHAFEHLGGYAHQAEAAAASGATIIYASGIGGDGYSGLPAPEAFAERKRIESEYARDAKARGIKTVLGYVCATSIVGLERFDANWTPEQRELFGGSPAEWLQQDRHGVALPSWYGGEYRPACMNHPGWRAYERYIVRQQLETGHDGIFFDNPTVHPKGCYCPACMTRFETFLLDRGVPVLDPTIKGLRRMTETYPRDFAAFRCTIARDFLAEMRAYARTINPNAVVTANNSLNSASVLFSQCKNYGYNIFEMSKAEDFVVVEDMSSQPRTDAKGNTIEYGPSYRQLLGVVHGRPLVAVTIAEADYHTPPALTQLAMAEAAAHGASYLAWTTWPEEQRSRMTKAVRQQADWLRAQAARLNGSTARAGALVFLPFRRWQDDDRCAVSDIASQLTRENVQYGVTCEDSLALEHLRNSRVLVLENKTVLTAAESEIVEGYESGDGLVVTSDSPGWLAAVRAAEDSIRIGGHPKVRAVVRDSPDAVFVFLYNLDIRRLSSFEEEAHPAREVDAAVVVPEAQNWKVTFTSPDGEREVPLESTMDGVGGPPRVHFTLPELTVSGIAILRREL